ncbi:MAG TPA: phosphoglycerate kinase [Candidatus Dormibacteraeota bacterium]|nr:phosphoglycerate kinase [Candidatus Dormibacteraeota bacterium]
MGLQLPDGGPDHLHGGATLKASIASVDVNGKKVLVREDFNVPMANGAITDDTRIRAAIPTLRDLMHRGAMTIVMSHLGRPTGPDPAFSLRPVAHELSKHLWGEVPFASDCVGPMAESAVGRLQQGKVLLLENVRFHAEEDEKNDPVFAQKLASHGEIYCNDAFAVSHRAHASVVGVASYLPAYAGQLMLAELEALHAAIDNPRRPLIAVIGGAKVSTKINLLNNLVTKVDALLIGGAMANTFLRAQGYTTGRSLVEEGAVEAANEVWKIFGNRLGLPIDLICAEQVQPGVPTRIFNAQQVEPGWIALDIGPQTVAAFAERVKGAGTVVWNGPMGMFEIPDFGHGTRGVGEAIASSGAYTLVGGGDTAAAVDALGLTGRFSHVSTGGGATLEYLEGRELPGVAILKEA